MNVAPRRKAAAITGASSVHLLTQANETKEVTLERLQNARKIVAKLIAAGNTKYLPIFQRLTQEIERYQQDESDLNLALRIAQR
ncbi:hypothetical protein PsWM33_02522 [Pseudovibrio sp. WM33]|nr:hypothetical protein PsWM33_02522 [Pseudovibrio sp. WM33]